MPMKELPTNNSLARQMLFKERLQQLLINKKNIWWSCNRLSVCFVWSYNTYISLGIVKDSSDCSADQKFKLEWQNKPRP